MTDSAKSTTATNAAGADIDRAIDTIRDRFPDLIYSREEQRAALLLTSPFQEEQIDTAFAILDAQREAGEAAWAAAQAEHAALGDCERPICNAHAAKWIRRLAFTTLDLLEVEAPGPRLLERYHPTAHTIIFGPGGIGKGSLLANDVMRLARQGHRVLIIDFEHHPEEWRPRIFTLGGVDVLSEVGYVQPPPGAIWDPQQLADLAAAIEHHRATILVVDSIVMACQGVDTSGGDTKAPTQYAAAIEHLGLPTISLAHVPKDNKNPEHPFGSAFWTYTARLTYSLTAKGEHRILQSRKSNNYEHAPKAQIELIWDDNRLLSVEERPYHQALTEAIEDVLTEPMTIKAIEQAVNKALDEDQSPHSAKAIELALDRGLGKGRFTKAGKSGREGRWALNTWKDAGLREGDGSGLDPSEGTPEAIPA
jgi:hypothetical protein